MGWDGYGNKERGVDVGWCWNFKQDSGMKMAQKGGIRDTSHVSRTEL